MARLDGIVLADHQLARRLPPDPRPHAVVRNFLDETEWSEVTHRGRSVDLRCVYVGDITLARGALRMCDAIEACRQAGLSATLDLVGPCPPSLRARIEAHPAVGWITLHGRLGREAVAARLARSDVGFGFFEPTPAYREGLPVKLFEYLASGLTVAGTAMPRIRAEARLAEGLFLVDWTAPPAELVTAIRAAHAVDDDTRRTLSNLVLRHYNWTGEAQKLIGLYETLLAP